jgi:hypothetical protein
MQALLCKCSAPVGPLAALHFKFAISKMPMVRRCELFLVGSHTVSSKRFCLALTCSKKWPGDVLDPLPVASPASEKKCN